MTKEETWPERADRRDILKSRKGEIRLFPEDEADERMPNSFISQIEHQRNRISRLYGGFFMPLLP